jgi:hypothetical protein
VFFYFVVVVVVLFLRQGLSCSTGCLRTCHVAQAGLKLVTLLPQPPEFWDYRCLSHTHTVFESHFCYYNKIQDLFWLILLEVLVHSQLVLFFFFFLTLFGFPLFRVQFQRFSCKFLP